MPDPKVDVPFFLIFTAPLGGTFYYFMVQSIEEEAAAQHPQK